MSGRGNPRSVRSRREFFEGVLATTAASLAASCSSDKQTSAPDERVSDAQKRSRGSDTPSSPSKIQKPISNIEGTARVVVVRDPGVMDRKNRPDRKRLRYMLERGLMALTGVDDGALAICDLVAPAPPQQVVGLKVNCLGGPRLCTHPAFAETVAEFLVKGGLTPRQVLIWDRTDGELARCGFKVNKGGDSLQCHGTAAFETEAIEVGGVSTRLSTLVTSKTTATINIPVLKSHTLAGFSGALKNELGCVNNARDFHGEHCRAAADVSALDAIHKKRRLVICDALRPLYDKGPMDVPRYRWVHGALIFATDPVAADLVGRAILEEKRKEIRGGQPWPLTPRPTHLDRAIELGLGAANLESVELIEA